MNRARGRADGAIWSVADRPPVGKDSALAAQGPSASARRSPARSRPQGAGGHPVDSTQRRPLAGSAGGVSASVHLLATAAGLGGARGLAENLAGVSSGIERAPTVEVE